MKIDRVHFYVEDAKTWRDWFVRVLGFYAIARGNDGKTQTEVVSSFVGENPDISPIVFVLSSPLNSHSPVAEFLSLHPPGVADIAFAVPNLLPVMTRAVSWGAKVKESLQQWESSQGRLRWIQIVGITGLYHTLIERQGKTPYLPYDWIVAENSNNNPEVVEAIFTGIDHLVLNVPTGELATTVSWYERVFGFQQKQAFAIQTSQSGLYSEVLWHPESGFQLPVNEPRSANSQIQEFLDINRGPGIQHIALRTDRIIEGTKRLRDAGLSFLKPPTNYYYDLKQKYFNFDFSLQEWQQIFTEGIMLDFEEKQESGNIFPLLLQIFSQPIFSQPTFFFELIERRDRSNGFGEGNFQALFAAIEQEQLKRLRRNYEL